MVTGGIGAQSARTWAADRGTIAVAGIYTAPSSSGTDTIRFSVVVSGKTYHGSKSITIT